VLPPPPEHSKEVQEEHEEIKKLRKTKLGRTMAGLLTDLKAHKAVAGYSTQAAADMENEIETLEFLIKKKTQPIALEGDAKDAWDTQRNKNHNKREQELAKHRGQCFGLIRGQCTRTLIGKMEHHASWSTTIKSGDPLLLPVRPD
jgi:hypothetical protein